MALRSMSRFVRLRQGWTISSSAKSVSQPVWRPYSLHKATFSSCCSNYVPCTGSYCTLPQRGSVATAGLRYISHSSAVCKVFEVKNNDEFMEKVMNSNVPVIVNFHADWCDPCKILTPELRKLVEKTEGLDLAIVDVEHNAELVHTFEVKAVPAVIAIRHGRVVDKFIGLVEADMMEKLVDKLAGMVKNAGDSAKE